jgi:hypothetical protein
MAKFDVFRAGWRGCEGETGTTCLMCTCPSFTTTSPLETFPLYPSCHLQYIVNFLLLIRKVRSHVTARPRHNIGTLEIIDT